MPKERENKLSSIELRPTALAWPSLAFDLDLQSPASYRHALLTFVQSTEHELQTFQAVTERTNVYAVVDHGALWRTVFVRLTYLPTYFTYLHAC